jgi:ATP-binding cassette subfamily B protein
VLRINGNYGEFTKAVLGLLIHRLVSMISRIAKLPRLLYQYNHSAYWCANVYEGIRKHVIAFQDFEDQRSGETLGRLQK